VVACGQLEALDHSHTEDLGDGHVINFIERLGIRN